MDARCLRAVVLTAAFFSLGASHRTTNFLVEAPTAEMAQEFAQAAERFRKELAIEWLGEELPRWLQPCPISATVGPQLGAGGATTFTFDQTPDGRPTVGGWRMSVQGSRERILDSVLPHEVTHTVFATHFRRPLPRWADEGACTTVEHTSERAKHEQWLVTFLRTGRGIPFDKMFAMKEYPPDIMPLYAQGHSAARFLIAQGGRRKFVQFIETGFKTSNWPAAVTTHYGYSDLGTLQNTWVKWVAAGSREPIAPEYAGRPNARPNEGLASRSDGAAANTVAAAERPMRPLAPIRRAPEARPEGRPLAASVQNSPAQATLAQVGPSSSPPPARSGPNELSWYARGTRTGGVRTDVAAMASQEPRGESLAAQSIRAAHPSQLEPARQVLLEWNRPGHSPAHDADYDASLPNQRTLR